MVKEPRKIIDGLDLLACDFGSEATIRSFSESNWDYLNYQEAPTNQIEQDSSSNDEELEIWSLFRFSDRKSKNPAHPDKTPLYHPTDKA